MQWFVTIEIHFLKHFDLKTAQAVVTEKIDIVEANVLFVNHFIIGITPLFSMQE